MRKLLIVGVLLNAGILFAIWQQLSVVAEVGSGAGVANPCEADPTLYALDTNKDGNVDLSDGIYFLSWFFSGGDAPQVCLAGNDLVEERLAALEASIITKASLKFPQGTEGEWVHFSLGSGQSYAVAAGKTLYISSCGSGFPGVSGYAYGTDGGCPMFPEGTVLEATTPSSPAGYTGILIENDSAITPVYFPLDNSSLSYTVPVGKRLVLKSGTGQGAPLCIGGVQYRATAGNIWLLPANTTINRCDSRDDAFGYTGYLVSQ